MCLVRTYLASRDPWPSRSDAHAGPCSPHLSGRWRPPWLPVFVHEMAWRERGEKRMVRGAPRFGGWGGWMPKSTQPGSSRSREFWSGNGATAPDDRVRAQRAWAQPLQLDSNTGETALQAYISQMHTAGEGDRRLYTTPGPGKNKLDALTAQSKARERPARTLETWCACPTVTCLKVFSLFMRDAGSGGGGRGGRRPEEVDKCPSS